MTEPEEFRSADPPDTFQRLWTPHRMAYIKGEGRPRNAEECPFCDIPDMGDEDGLVLVRRELVYAVLNRYPYNSGHLMVVPYRHVADYTELDEPETLQVGTVTQQALTTLRSATGAEGFNVGINLGKIAGAGISAHLHQHVVPRWGGDSNFMPIIGSTKVLPQLLSETRAMLAEAWPRG